MILPIVIVLVLGFSRWSGLILGSPFAEDIFSRLQRSSVLKSVPGVPLRSTPGFSPVAPPALKIICGICGSDFGVLV